MRVVILILILFCTSCASNSTLESESSTVNLNERQVQCIKDIKIEEYSSEEYKNEKEMCIKYHTPNKLGAILQAAVSVVLLTVIF